MKAVFKHEISSYFTSLTGYVFGAFLLLFAGIYTMAYNLKSGIANFEYVPGSMGFIFLVIVPILTMRVLAEERRQKTDQLLYSLPVSMTEVVLGKFFALLAVFAVPVCVMCVYPLILCAFGNVYLPAAFGSVVAFIFLGTALLSIGMFISSVTESQAVAAGLCFVVMLLNYFLSSLADLVTSSAAASFVTFTIAAILLALIIYKMTKSGFMAIAAGVVLEVVILATYTISGKSFEGIFPELMDKLSLFERFNVFINGIFDLTGIVYFIGITVFFLFLSVQSLEKRRWSE